LSRQTLAGVVEPRYEELFTLVQAELQRSGFENLIAGIVLTGGSSAMEGIVELAEQVFHMPVRQGLPDYAKGLHEVIRNPIYSTAVGLLLVGNENRNARLLAPAFTGNQSWLTRLKNWLQGNF
jgi:cell division protein FtsA